MAVKIFNSRGKTYNVRLSKNLPDVVEENLPEEPVYDLPVWVSSGDLGSFNGGEEVAITLEYTDTSNVLDYFVLSGSLPTGVVFNDVGGTISGFIEDTTSTTYNFTITMVTIYGDEVTESFSMDSVITQSEITWDTDSDLGTYDSGQSVNQPISASVEETTV